MVCCRLCRGWICFCTVLIDGRKLSRHDKVVKMESVPISEQDLSCHDKIVKMALQKQRQLSVGLQPIDFVLGAGTVRVKQDLISGNEFTLIDFWGRLRNCPAAEGNKLYRLCWLQLFLSGCKLSCFTKIRFAEASG